MPPRGINVSSKRWRRIRYVALARSGFLCVYCREPATTVDHLRPKSYRGSALPENLVGACERCNNERGRRDLQKWLTVCVHAGRRVMFRSAFELVMWAAKSVEEHVDVHQKEVR